MPHKRPAEGFKSRLGEYRKELHLLNINVQMQFDIAFTPEAKALVMEQYMAVKTHLDKEYKNEFR